jgi:hypothetical protein
MSTRHNNCAMFALLFSLSFTLFPLLVDTFDAVRTNRVATFVFRVGSCVTSSSSNVPPPALDVPNLSYSPRQRTGTVGLVFLSQTARNRVSCIPLLNGEILYFLYFPRKQQDFVFLAYLS